MPTPSTPDCEQYTQSDVATERRPSALDGLWLPAQFSEQNVLTSAELVESAAADNVVLYVGGDAVASFTVPTGIGARLLTEFGLERQEP